MVYLALAIALIAALIGPELWAKQVLASYSRDEYFSGTGFDLAQLLVRDLGLKDVVVESSSTGDHYDPDARAVRLTSATCGRRSLTAVVVAAHEVGHAVQDSTGFAPFRIRNTLVRTSNVIQALGGMLFLGVPLFAAVTGNPVAIRALLPVALVLLCLPVLVHLITLPVELDASFRRALPLLLHGNYIPAEDEPAARRILTACALTYVAGALASVLNIWRWLRFIRR
jgi:hypothetical protein